MHKRFRRFGQYFGLIYQDDGYWRMFNLGPPRTPEAAAKRQSGRRRWL